MQAVRFAAGLPFHLNRRMLNFESAIQHFSDGRANHFEISSRGQFNMDRKAMIVTGQRPHVQIVNAGYACGGGNSRAQIGKIGFGVFAKRSGQPAL